MSPSVHDHPFGLQALPFAATADPGYLYLSMQHKEALAHLLYGLGTDGGFVVLSGDEGTGKTTLCRCLLDELPAQVEAAFIARPEEEVEPLLASICTEFGIELTTGKSARRYVDQLNALLLSKHALGRQSVLIIDDAHRLGVDVLEQLRLLTNLETNERKLVQIVLVGRPALRERLARPELRQLSQRIVARFHLCPLSRADVGAYVQHRLTVAGGPGKLFPARLSRRLHAFTKGVPRSINLLCERALQGASQRGHDQVHTSDLSRAANEIGLSRTPCVWPWSLVIASGATLSVALCAVVVIYLTSRTATAGVDPLEYTPPSVVAGLADVEASHPSAPQSPTAATATHFSWPDATRQRLSIGDAFASLLQQWGAALGPRQAPCFERLPDGLRCLQGRAGLGELLALNLPVVLHLRNEQGDRTDALLSTVSDNTATIKVAGVEHQLALNALSPWWRGEYTVVWRAPPGFEEPLRPGQRGPAVAWLRKRLALLQNQPEPGVAERPFDRALLRQLQDFQLSEHLVPDGTAGVKTLARLAARTDPTVPALTVERLPR